MKQNKKVSTQIKFSLWLSIIMVAAFLMVGFSVMTIRPFFGYMTIAGAFVFLIAAVVHYEYFEKLATAELLAAGFEQGQIQKDLLKELPVPYILTDDEGLVIWYNNSFAEMAGEKTEKKNITQMFASLYKKVFPKPGSTKEFCITMEDRKFRVECKSVCMTEEEKEKGETDPDNVLLAFYFFDETQLMEYREESKSKRMVAGLIYIDNYEEVLENMEEVRQSLLLALVERKVIRYMQGLDAIVKKFEKDKFLFVFEEKNLQKLMESKFSLLDEVRMINIGNELSMTLSISVGVNAPTYVDTYESARIAMDLALGRGGDQAVVKDGDSISYYGGKTQKVEKSTRVKARVKAHALREIIMTHDKIFIMGHKLPDADAVGAALGIYRLARTFDKKTYIVMDKDCAAIRPIVEGMINDSGAEDFPFITNEQALSLRDASSMLIIVDVNLPAMTECPELIKQIETIVVLDHHRQNNDTIKKAVVSYVEPYASSSCEMVAEILQYIPDKPKLRPIEADALYSGILVDTDNFVVKAGVRTFEAAAYLRRAGADVTRVRKMFREDMENCKIRADIINRAELFYDEFAISTFDGRNVDGATVIGAKAANALLDVQGIRGSFVITEISSCIYVSARSIDDLNVQIIMEKFGGGGHLTVAAAQLKDKTMDEVVNDLKNLLASMKKEGDI
ncbi:MAG TPA: DHH family phosphoesterase [Candidatus Anaerobutyricum stercoris]|uniref:Cyclic-di-AMP phosphodiesterase n=1 Tax=Candidatus Anaerobutyricum stercoris TaxID=2838457 RepID=A0A9D2EKU1_9FIRM|nr:DHH family phosphoesterase [Eubacterium sp. An3]OUO29213.1 DHH family phosphoesterase [Eubacterium sp. An3]HIZ39062.1 DHH family phosphoesterase [Candidatus Anaerobutyricum stercoris]